MSVANPDNWLAAPYECEPAENGDAAEEEPAYDEDHCKECGDPTDDGRLYCGRCAVERFFDQGDRLRDERDDRWLDERLGK